MAQHDATKRLLEMSYRGRQALERIKKHREQILSRMEGARQDLHREGAKVRDQLDQVRKRLVADPGGYRSPAQILGKIEGLLRRIDSSIHRPTAAQSEWIEPFEKDLEGVLASLEEVVSGDLARFNRKLTEPENDPVAPEKP